ncbi:MAG: DUF4097 family beta strand repeat-containing protein [Candidatus Halalkalibacterium sp. M3_1C_030]
MKKLITLSTLLLFCGIFLTAEIYAQEFTYTLGNSPDKTIEFTLSRSDVVIEGHDSDEVVIRNLDFDAPPERAKGLKALYNSAEDNTGIGLSVEEENGTLKIITASRDNGDYRLMVPNRVRVMIEEINWGGGDFELRNLQGEIEIKSKNGDMKLMNITGPIIASSTSGDMEISMDNLSQMGPTSISLVSGFIDISMPANSKANLFLSSISGEIYTDLDIQISGNRGESMRRLGGGRKIEGILNGGGVEVSLKTISGDIYLRKSDTN